jgi:hypothetical protein
MTADYISKRVVSVGITRRFLTRECETERKRQSGPMQADRGISNLLSGASVERNAESQTIAPARSGVFEFFEENSTVRNDDALRNDVVRFCIE